MSISYEYKIIYFTELNIFYHQIHFDKAKNLKIFISISFKLPEIYIRQQSSLMFALGLFGEGKVDEESHQKEDQEPHGEEEVKFQLVFLRAPFTQETIKLAPPVPAT